MKIVSSCLVGMKSRYNGSSNPNFTGKLRNGDGVTTALLKRNDIKVKTESD